MLFPSEMTAFEYVGSKKIMNPLAAVAICDARRMAERKQREIERAGLTMHEAIERALRRRPVRAVGAAASQPPTTGSGSG